MCQSPSRLMDSTSGVLARPGRKQKQDCTAPWPATCATGVGAQRVQGGRRQLKKKTTQPDLNDLDDFCGRKGHERMETLKKLVMDRLKVWCFFPQLLLDGRT